MNQNGEDKCKAMCVLCQMDKRKLKKRVVHSIVCSTPYSIVYNLDILIHELSHRLLNDGNYISCLVLSNYAKIRLEIDDFHNANVLAANAHTSNYA